MARTHVVLDEEVIDAINKRVGQRGRSRFIEAAGPRELERDIGRYRGRIFWECWPQSSRRRAQPARRQGHRAGARSGSGCCGSTGRHPMPPIERAEEVPLLVALFELLVEHADAERFMQAAVAADAVESDASWQQPGREVSVANRTDTEGGSAGDLEVPVRCVRPGAAAVVNPDPRGPVGHRAEWLGDALQGAASVR